MTTSPSSQLRAFLEDWGVHSGVTLFIMGVGLVYGGEWLRELAQQLDATPGISTPGIHLLAWVGAVAGLASGVVAFVAGGAVSVFVWLGPGRDD